MWGITARDIVIGADRCAAVPDFATVELDLIQVKGQTRGVHIYALIGDETVAAESSFQNLQTKINDMLVAYRRQGWAATKAALGGMEGAETYGLEGLIELYQDRIEEHKATPPAPDWNGVFVAETKDAESRNLPPQHAPSWIGGHGTVPYEQYTQQSPCFGFKTSPQPLQSQNHWHESVGMVSVSLCPL